MPAAVAAGHPATAETGRAILAAGGSAADAAVAAALTSCVAETVMTGLGGGGFATYLEPTSGSVHCLDFFTAVPGLGATRAAAPLTHVDVRFGGVPLDFSVGAPSVAVPGVPAGLATLHRRWGRLPWPEVIRPAAELAGTGVPLPEAHARTLVDMRHVMLPGDGGAAYAPGGRLLGAGETLRHPGLAEAFRLLAEEGPAAFYRGELGQLAVQAVADGGGLLGLADLAAYRVEEVRVDSADFAGARVHGRVDLLRTVATFAALPPDLPGLDTGARALALAGVLGGAPDGLGDTTSVSVVDADGGACVVTTSLGVGAGVWVPGYGIHLNSMLGEGELFSDGHRPGDRMASMMCPLVVTTSVDGAADVPVLAVGAAGASRIRSALLQVVTGVLVDGRAPADAIMAPRLHVAGRMAHVEPGVPEEATAALHAAGYEVTRWPTLAHYFGGVSAVGLGGAGADPRRGGAVAAP